MRIYDHYLHQSTYPAKVITKRLKTLRWLSFHSPSPLSLCFPPTDDGSAKRAVELLPIVRIIIHICPSGKPKVSQGFSCSLKSNSAGERVKVELSHRNLIPSHYYEQVFLLAYKCGTPEPVVKNFLITVRLYLSPVKLAKDTQVLQGKPYSADERFV